MTELDVKNQYGVITVNEKGRENDPKFIRFITPGYKDLFKIADGERIIISYGDGQKETSVCNYLDPYHFRIGNRAYHICEFAEIMEQIGATVSPAGDTEIAQIKKDKHREER